MNIIMMNS